MPFRQKPKQLFSRLLAMLALTGVIVGSGIVLPVFAQAAPPEIISIQSASGSTSGSLFPGERIRIGGNGFGTYEEDSSYVEFIPATPGATAVRAKLPFPAPSHWEDDIINLNIPSSLSTNTTSYSVVVYTNNQQSEPYAITLQSFTTPPNMYGTPDYTEDFVITNANQINVSDAIRQISQSMLLPTKETIIDLGRYTQEALIFKLDLGDTESDALEALHKVWEFSRQIVNSLFVLGIAIIGMMITFRLDMVTGYSLRQVIMRLMMATIFANVSLVISRAMTDITLVFSHILLDQLNLPAFESIATPLLGELRLNMFVVFMLGFYLLVAAVMALVAIMLILRVVAVWLMIAASPFVFFGMIFPFSANLPIVWLKRFGQLLVMGPVIAFLLYVGKTVSDGAQQAAANPDMMQALVGTATLSIILSSPFWLNSFFGLVGNAVGQESKTSAKNVSAGNKNNNQGHSQPGGKATERPLSDQEIKQRLGLHDVDLSKVQTATPTSINLQERVMNVFRNENDTEAAIDSENTAKEAPEKKSTPRQESAPEQESEEGENRDGLDRIIDTDKLARKPARKAPEKSVSGKLIQASSKLFGSAPKTLILNWLGDQSKHRIISEGITAQRGEVPGEKAATIFDHPNGKLILDNMVSNGNDQQKDASSTLIGNVLLSYPDRLQKVIEDSVQAAPPINLAAQNVLQAGIAKLGQRLMMDPEDEKLQKAAERVVLYAPHLLTNILSQPAEDGAGFIRLGINNVAQNIGEQISSALNGKSLIAAQQQDDDNSKRLRELSTLATQSLLFPQVDFGKVGKTPEERQFVVAAALNGSPDSSKIVDRIALALDTQPDNADLLTLSGELYKNSPVEQLSTLPDQVSQATTRLIASDSFANAPDMALLARYLSGSKPSQLATQPLPANITQKISLEELQAALGDKANSEEARLLPVQLALGSNLADLSKDLSSQIGASLATIAGTHPELVGEVLKKALSANTPDAIKASRPLLDSALNSPEAVQQLPSAEAHSMLDATPIERLNDLNQSPEVASALVSKILENADQINDPELAAKMLHLVSKEAISTLPWNIMKSVMQFLVKLDRKHPLHAELSEKIAAHPQAKAEQEQASATQQGLPKADADAPAPPPIQAIVQTPIDQLSTMQSGTFRQLLETVNQSPGEIDPALAAKIFKLAGKDDLSLLGKEIREAAASYLMSKDRKNYSKHDAEVAAKVVAATPEDYLGGLNESILTLAETISESNIAFTDREELRTAITGALERLLESKGDPDAEETVDEETSEKSEDEDTPPVAQSSDDEEENDGKLKITI